LTPVAERAQDFSKIVTTDVLPLLKQQPGLAHELMMVRDNQAVSISVDRGPAGDGRRTT
jgi:hypothetical protein